MDMPKNYYTISGQKPFKKKLEKKSSKTFVKKTKNNRNLSFHYLILLAKTKKAYKYQ
jgi:hypothetical protein